ncbi:hypothetical protein I6M59_17820 [Shewanella algae]|uniref:hypothetical protein n=1 Tax=Shewanella algae TaxID=38313 RepID=UPI001AAE1BA7|nr:hypothetical protein [Shewanella algae]MBO2693577.1 hypothetical protein [Shewanella algae]
MGFSLGVNRFSLKDRALVSLIISLLVILLCFGQQLSLFGSCPTQGPASADAVWR